MPAKQLNNIKKMQRHAQPPKAKRARIAGVRA
jgi:hypothetical protein